MGILSRRFLVLAALLFWQGGFIFYASVVVPIGQQVLHSPVEQGFITRRVSVYLNLAGAVALLPLAWDVVATRDPSTWRRRARWFCWAGLGSSLVLLVWLYPRLDGLLDPEGMEVLDRKAFRLGHRVYLWGHTVQWIFGVVYMVLMVGGWRGEDKEEVRRIKMSRG